MMLMLRQLCAAFNPQQLLFDWLSSSLLCIDQATRQYCHFHSPSLICSFTCCLAIVKTSSRTSANLISRSVLALLHWRYVSLLPSGARACTVQFLVDSIVTRMAMAVALWVFQLLALATTFAMAADPELTTDFFVPEGINKTTLTGEYFTSRILRNGSGLLPPAKFAIKRVNSESFPALTGLGVSTALLEYLPGGINTLHTHPRGTEVLVVAKGTLNVGLVDSTNKLFTSVLQKADIFVFPRGLVHYQINLGSETVIAYAAFSSSNPGTISLPANIFASGIDDVVLETAFKVSGDVIDELQAALAT